ncbi:DEAD/DEAH box helicase [Leclercia sp. AS011]|uniref:DEAD/DEAH box helicase n=1 Tax=Leclercia sp. AS011 TaxID=3081257 RepID=UPI003016FA2B
MLREWQSQCVDAVLGKYQSGSPHFLCLACPGAGKTVMAAEVAKRMLELNLVDIIICFAPSTAVVSSIKSTFSHRLQSSFCGGLGSVGTAFTYHNLMYFDKKFWESLQRHRLLIIFDEIHHCSGDTLDNANVWGGEILTLIQKCASYTLALTGTPWRTDNVPIVLSNYTDPDGEICCDYVYGLHEAIIDNVCRKPKIALINSDNLVYSSEETTKDFGSIVEILNENLVSYQSILWHPKAMSYVIKAGCEKLREIRMVNSDAGGLVVASSVVHAYKLMNLLENEFGQSATIVTYHDKEALSKIKQYRQGTTEWIVSVGMISEGTDIPRLQVCCHLSSIKTELYFRQVLGRILRVNQRKNQEAWLFTIATEELTLYSERLVKDLPEDYKILQESHESPSKKTSGNLFESLERKQNNNTNKEENFSLEMDFNESHQSTSSVKENTNSLKIHSLYQQVIDAFLFSTN